MVVTNLTTATKSCLWWLQTLRLLLSLAYGGYKPYDCHKVLLMVVTNLTTATKSGLWWLQTLRLPQSLAYDGYKPYDRHLRMAMRNLYLRLIYGGINPFTGFYTCW